jgi:N-acetylneuraminate synthase
MVNEGLAAIQALGDDKWDNLETEAESRKLRRSLYITEDVKKGDVISSKNLRSIRPNGGLSPRFYQELLGKKFTSDHLRGTAMKLEYAE